MKTSLLLAYPITLRGGRDIISLQEGFDVISELPKNRQLKLIWQATTAILLEAQKTGNENAVRHATAQLCRALQGEGWIT